MGDFKYPYSSFEKINLDWVLRKIKALEPAIPLVEQSSAIVEEVHTTAREAAAAAESAQQTVATVTALAEQANETSEEAKEIATQAASATIADGSVVWAKLGSDVQQAIKSNETRSTTAATHAALAQQAATNAQSAATEALSTADTAQSTANTAQTAANNAQNAISRKSDKWIYAAALSAGASIALPEGATCVLCEVVDSRSSITFIASTIYYMDLNRTAFVNVPVYDADFNNTIFVSASITAGKVVTFDPNHAAPSGITLRVYYS